MKDFFIKIIKIYQHSISPLFPAACRYYPSCSEYALIQFKHNFCLKAFFLTILRILRCNQLFKGGIDYPIIYKDFSAVKFSFKNRNLKFLFWFVPYKNGKYYVIKSYKKEN